MSFRSFFIPTIAIAVLTGAALVPASSGMANVDPDKKLISPIFVSTGDDSIITLTSAENGVLFDIDGDGDKDQVAWTEAGSDDAILAVDIDNNRTIDGVKEIFGEFSPQGGNEEKNGFNALRRFDEGIHGGNRDNRIDSSDAVWPKLYLWRDLNHDGIAQIVSPGCDPSTDPNKCAELIKLTAMVGSISLQYYSYKWFDQHGNWFRYASNMRPRETTREWWACDIYVTVIRTLPNPL